MKKIELEKEYRKRINGLIEKLDSMDTISSEHYHEIVEGCFMGTLTIVELLYGGNSFYAKAMFEARKAYLKKDYDDIYDVKSISKSIKGTLLNIEEELDAGLVRSIAKETVGIVISDLVALAKEELKAGYTNVAAVLATAALEDALKRKAEELSINVEDKTMPSVINSLKSKSFFKGAQVPIVSSFVKLRNAAMHAEWDKIQESDVSSLIGFLEPFLLEHFS